MRFEFECLHTRFATCGDVLTLAPVARECGISVGLYFDTVLHRRYTYIRTRCPLQGSLFPPFFLDVTQPRVGATCR
jgi:hypothetical protein